MAFISFAFFHRGFATIGGKSVLFRYYMCNGHCWPNVPRTECTVQRICGRHGHSARVCEDRCSTLRAPDTAACAEMDELLAETMVRLSRMAIFYTVDRNVVSGFDELYELEDDDFALLFYYRGRRMQCDFGRFGKYKLTVVPPSTDTFIDVISELYYNAQLGRFSCTSPWQP